METGDTQLLNKNLIEYCNKLRQERVLNNKVLFINCPQFNIENFEPEVAIDRCYYAYPPTGLQCLVSALSRRNLDVRILDLNFEVLKKVNTNPNFDYNNWISILDGYLKEFNPSVVGISNFFAIDTPYFKKISDFLRKQKNLPIILAGGQNATYNAKKFLEEKRCDFVCLRESENKVRYLFDILYQENKKRNPTPGILFSFNGKIEETEGKKDIVDLKEDIIHTYRTIPIEEYCKVGSTSPFSRMAGENTIFSGILLNRGCRGNCKFCDVVDYTGKGVRSREPKDFLDEMTYLYDKRGVRYFEILDDDFTRYKNKTLEVLNGIIKKGLKISWAVNNGIIASSLDEKIMEVMRDSGCIGFHTGVESGDLKMLKEIRKPGNLNSFKNFSRIAKKFPEMFIVDNYIFGFPGEKFEQMINSFNFSREMNLDWSSYAIYQQNVNFFGDHGVRKEESIGDFVPTKDGLKGKLASSELVLTGRNVFDIDPKAIPPREQLNHIWFSFNLIRNFILNKNLRSDGRVQKFISWVEVIKKRYPTHPYMNLFLSFAYNLSENNEKARLEYEKMEENLKDPYWKEKFEQFNLHKILESFPKSKKQTREALDFLIEKNVPK